MPGVKRPRLPRGYWELVALSILTGRNFTDVLVTDVLVLVNSNDQGANEDILDSTLFAVFQFLRHSKSGTQGRVKRLCRLQG
ncbi:hypothetical protein A6X21_05450 [Planctopirus hydrillae]|uniref:Uncharacterized protein n=1 Tax=Planctopirus hydrillae TaxID=1841610 RepID=A0A1C3EC05_9PLAN|nr:hypothetical protein A6X21_05450 [Planctopirus hydrillae]